MENTNELSTQEGQNDVCEQEIDIKLEKTDLENPTPELNPDTVTGDLFLLCHGKPVQKTLFLSVLSLMSRHV